MSDVAAAIEDAPESVRATTPLTGFADLVIRSVLPLLLALVAGGILIAALGHNPFPIVVPCHRVVAADGRLGGFSANGGVATKRKLLLIEGAASVPRSLFD